MLYLSRSQVRAIDRESIERYQIPGIVLMENAALSAARVAQEMLPKPAGSRVLVLCGGGNNGGDGLAIARHLHNAGMTVHLALTIDPAKYQGDALINWQIVQAMNLRWSTAEAQQIAREPADLIIDAIFGTGLTEAPRPPFGYIADAVASNGAPVLAIDLPSGLDCDTGRPPGACIAATRTITFVAEKIGFAQPEARRWLGEVTVGSIGCPRELIERVARDVDVHT